MEQASGGFSSKHLVGPDARRAGERILHVGAPVRIPPAGFQMVACCRSGCGCALAAFAARRMSVGSVLRRDNSPATFAPPGFGVENTGRD
ncbi:hypothetical protein ColTof4_12603 [Colletotrichum tofieldiae]|nr:hypothetical protein ColTof3_06443 [Colletotrichum tofieldiae]GKT80180.1 hypothetical protein ColTof4_12603 [Colletotrichum tofieldiae]